MERLFGLDAQLLFEVFLTAIAVFVLFFVLSYILFNPVRDLLRKRQEMIRETKEQAFQEKEDALKLKAKYGEKLQKAENEAEEFLFEKRKLALKRERIILEQAKAEASRIIAKGSAEIELEKKKAMDDLKKELIDVAMLMAGKIIAVSMDEKTKELLLADTLKEMSESTWQI